MGIDDHLDLSSIIISADYEISVRESSTKPEVIPMNGFIRIAVIAALICIGAGPVMAIEEATYEVIQKSGNFEVRDYAPYILAETVVDGSLEEAAGKAFDVLFDYISGDNRKRDKISMTAPVSQRPTGEKLRMTAPVVQQRANERWVVSFVMPDSHTLETLPEPNDSRITLRQFPARRMAAIRYSGFWSEKRYLRHKAKLEAWIKGKELAVAGSAIWARYNPPLTPWFMRRNEILIPVETDSDPGKAQKMHGELR